MTAAVPPVDPAVRSKDIQVLCEDLGTRLRGGSHLILYGPRGVGKSTVACELALRYRAIGTPCGLARHTSGLPDIVAALADAYPGTHIEGIGKRVARVRLRMVADRIPGVLLLDHATAMTTAMLGYLRRLRGGIAGTLLVVDIDSPRERERMRNWRAGALSIRMPVMPNRTLLQFLVAAIQAHGLPEIEPRMLHHLVRMAHGRIGWIKECICRLQMPEYWQDHRLHVAVLCTDTEITIRQSRRGPRLRYRHRQA